MKGLKYNKYDGKCGIHKTFYFSKNGSCKSINRLRFMVHTNEVNHYKRHIGKLLKMFYLTNSKSLMCHKLIRKPAIMNSIVKRNRDTKIINYQFGSSNRVSTKTCYPFGSNYVINVISEHRYHESSQLFNTTYPIRCKVYRCELNDNEISYCKACNSTAMFEVLKSLYDCYMRKTCDNCKCILCGNFFREKRRLARLKRSKTMTKLVTATENAINEQIQKAEKAMVGKTTAEKEKILKNLAMAGIPLPDGKTASEKVLINKLIKNLGLPLPPKTAADKEKLRKMAESGQLKPLEGLTAHEKEKQLQSLAEMKIPLPEGRTASEKGLIQKITESVSGASVDTISEKLRKAKVAGFLTPLENKPPEKQKRILKGLAMAGLPLPDVKSPSLQKLINEVRFDIGLPPEPKTAEMKEKYAKAADLGLMQPLEGQLPQEKERILKNLANMGIPLPTGRSPSEKTLIANIKTEPRPRSIVAPSEKMRQAKAAGLITPLKSKTPEQREKILKGLAGLGIPLPEGTTKSEKKLINKVLANLGLPPEPKTTAMRDKHAKAADAGLQSLAEMKIPLSEGRTASEKGLIQKITESVCGASVDTISEKLRKAKVAGFLTPLENKPPEKQKRILKGLAMAGLPLPEVKSPSLQKLINEVRFDIGLPPEPKTTEMKEKYAKAADLGLMQPLEGQLPQEKERILKNLANMGIPLPTGRSPSEKTLIANIKTEPRPRSIVAPSEKMRQAKAAGLITPLKSKTPEQREKILKGLAGLGIPLPEGTTKSEKKLINKVRANLGLPPEPKTTAMRDKHAKAADAGLLQPLEGKSPKEKERILRGLDDMGISLPEERTLSEKDLINKIKTKAPPILTPSKKMRPSKTVGLITPLKGKTPDKQEKILKGIANLGIPLPEGTTDSEKKLINKVRANLGLPAEPKTPSMQNKHVKAAAAGLLQPLENKTPKEKERILQGLKDIGIPLPEGRTPSEKALISKIKAEPSAPSILAPSERMRRAKIAGLLTPLQGKSPEKKENILKGLAKLGIPLPEGTTDSERNLMNKVRANLGLPPGPKTAAMKDKHAKAADADLLQPLEGKSLKEKERILRGLDDLGIPLPEGRTPSEKDLITKIKAEPHAPPILAPSEKLRRAKVSGLITPLKGKTSEQKENILKGLASLGIPLPEGKSDSEKKLIDKVRINLGLPPEPKTSDMKDKHAKVADAGLLQPLEGKPAKEKERILRGLNDFGIPLPEGRTSSEKALITKIKAEPRTLSILAPSEKMRRAKVAGLITPLKGKTPEKREKILKGLINLGIPLPEGTTDSEKKLINKVRANLGLPPEPKTSDMKDKHAKAADVGLLQPLEGKPTKEKERILRGLKDLGIPLPEGRSPSEKALISQIKREPRTPSILAPSEKMRRAKVAGLLTPLKGKTPEKKENILKGLANLGVPLPEGTTDSEKKLINKVRANLGLPPGPKTAAMKDKHAKAADTDLLQPLEGKSLKEKERILRGLDDLGIPLPEGRTPSEKDLITKIKAEPHAPPILAPSEKLRRAKVSGLITPLKGKTPEQKQNILTGLASLGIPLPEGKSDSEKKLIDKVRINLGLPPEPKTSDMKDKHAKVADAGLLQPLEGKPAKEKERILRGLNDFGIPLPEGRTSSEKALITKIKAEPRTLSILAPSEKMRRAKVAGLITPLKGKTPEKREKILKGLINLGIPLPEGTTDSEKKLINKVRANLGLPPEPKTSDMKDKHAKAADAGLLQPLEGKPTKEKERILRGLKDLGIPLPEGRSPSEKALISQIKREPRTPSILAPSEKMRRAKVAGLLTPLKGKTPEKKENILKGLANLGVPLPEGTTDSEKKLINKVRANLGLPPEPKTSAMKNKYVKAAHAGFLQPLEGKTPKEKERILQGLNDNGIPLPEGRTPSEKALINKIKLESRPQSVLAPSEKMRRAKVAGLITPLKGKSPEKKGKILKGLAYLGIPLTEGTTDSEKKLINKVRADLGLPPEPKTSSMKNKHAKAADAGLLQPLEGKPTKEKERILRGLNDLGIPLPEGRTPSEKALITNIKSEPRTPSILTPSEKMRRAKVAGLITPLKGKTPEQKEKIFRGLANLGMLLPEEKTSSEESLINKVRTNLGLPPKPTTSDMKDKHSKAANAGLLQPLEGKTPMEKEKILRGLKNIGIPLPEGRTSSEKVLITKIKAESRTETISQAKGATHLIPSAVKEGKNLVDECTCDRFISKSKGEPVLSSHSKRGPYISTPSERMRKAKAAGLLTPLLNKPLDQKKKLLKGLAMHGILLPEGTTSSEKHLMDKVRADLGLPPEPKTSTMRNKYIKATNVGLLLPLEGKTPKEKEKILRGLANIGIPLPKGSTPSEKALIAKVQKEANVPLVSAPSEKMRKAKAAGLITPLEGKTSEQKEKILNGLAMLGIPLPERTTASEKSLVNKVRANLGLPPTPKTSDMKAKHIKAAEAGLLQPLEGKPTKEKERILRGLADMGISLPEGRTPSEKALVEKYKLAKRPPSITTEKLRKAKETGILTPLEGKSQKDKERILKGLVETGLPLPEGRTPSDVALIKRIKTYFGILDDTTEEKVRRAKITGFLTPIEGKTPEQKEKILRGRAAAGLPLPIGKTPSEKDLINKIKVSSGYVTPSPSEKQKRAKAAGLITPIKGKTISKKIKILKDMVAAGVPIPEGETPSDKELIKRVTTPRKTKSEKMRDAKAAGLLTPLAGKTLEKKDEILRRLVTAGLPFPEAETPSEKNLIKKIRMETGLPPEPTTPSIKEKYKNAEARGLITPLEGKLPAEKEDILRKLEEAGIPLPEGRTASEKLMIKRIKKGMQKPDTREKKSTKATVCDHACGCDKKKIKFNHSYIKITVISPDMSSICDCSDECLPKLPSGVVTDNDGIKVTIGNIIGIPSIFSRDCSSTINNRVEKTTNHTIQTINRNIDRKILSIDNIHMLFDHMYKKGKVAKKLNSVSSFEPYPSGDDSNYTRNKSASPMHINDCNEDHNNRIYPYCHEIGAKGYFDYSRNFESISDIKKSPVFCFSNNNFSVESTESSLTSVFIVKSVTSLSVITSAESLYTYKSNSIVSYTDDTASNLMQYSDTLSYGHFSDTTMEYSSSLTNGYCSEDATESDSNLIRKMASVRRIGDEYNKYKKITQANIIILLPEVLKMIQQDSDSQNLQIGVVDR